MFVELLEKLRCPNPHEATALVATASRTVDRHIVEGTLGCPVCHAEFAIRDGVLDIGGDGAAATVSELHDDAPQGSAVRTGALLGLDERGGLYLLDSVSARAIPALVDLAPNALFIALSVHAGAVSAPRAAGTILMFGEALPLAPSSLRGAVIDRAAPGLVEAAAALLAAGGRLVAPAAAAVPEGITVLARDDEQWVGERAATPTLSAIRRAPR